MTDTPPDDTEVLAPGTLVFVVDPLCGWCWGAAPAIERLAAAGAAIEVVASGLFIGDRPMTEEFATYAWTNDQKIHALTGQTFSEAYHTKVLGDRTGRFDSGPATLALTCVQLREPSRALATLHALQAARWVDGRDIADDAVCADVLRAIGVAELTVAAFLAEDEDAIEALNHRATFARELMTRLGARGVPLLARVTETGAVKIDGRWLFEEIDEVVERVQSAAAGA